MYKIDLPLKAFLVANVLDIDRIYIKGIMCHKAIPGPERRVYISFGLLFSVLLRFLLNLK